MTTPFANLTPLHYGCIVADPPWRFKNFSAKGEAKNPVAHYACMSTADIAATVARLTEERVAA